MERIFRVVLLLVLAVLASGKPASYKENLIDSDLNKTVEEVVGILGQRPDLPRLTRGEILELVSDVRRQKSLEGNKNRQNSQEPLVVVMPFQPNGTSIEELFTQAPVTQVIGDLAIKLASKRPGQKRRRKPIPRPVYVHTEVTTQSTTPITVATETSPVEPVSVVQKIPPKTTPKPTTTEQSWKPLEELVIPDNIKDAIEEISIKRQTAKPVTSTPGTKKTTTKPVVPPEDVSIAAESLSDEMKDLLATFGLLGTTIEKDAPVTVEPKDPYAGFEFGAVKPKVDPNSYIGFKPLPESGDNTMTPDMKNFLASFGLINERNGRDMKSEISSKQKRSKERDDRTLKEVPKINSEMFSDDMMLVLENLGITNTDGTRKAKKLGEHIFNPAQRTAELNRTDQIEKVQKLVTKIKELSANHEIHSLTPSELREILKTEADLIQLGSDGNLLIKTDTLDPSGGPDPLSLDEIVELIDKNENKRQDSSEENSSTEPNPSISTRRYDTGDNLKLTDIKESYLTDEMEEDSTPEQSTNVVVTTPPEGSMTSEESSVKGDAESSEGNASAAASASTSSGNNSSSVQSNEERATSSASSSSSNSDVDSSSASASASASSSPDGDSSSNSATASVSSDSSSSTGSASASSETDSQPMAAEGPSFDDLNDSFGGEITTTPRPNGLFFLLDWNSFLQVGTDERKVDLTFNPKIGDPKNFFPIKFP